jgi:hypothetical protein
MRIILVRVVRHRKNLAEERRMWVCDRLSRGWIRARWDNVTAYMVGFLARPTTPLIRRCQECIPPQYRAVGGIARFVESLLLPPSEIDADADVG